ncbi:sensor histidine kinase [Nocardia inohanensis]|uniref:sensor histidine kinase n=1 Tax=Nocardia inohanensis TaxID=209246 RepID=UPI0008369272|nr:histidine kinase [Nocardia inohanensis]
MSRGIEWLLGARSIPARLLVLVTLAAGCLALLTRTADPIDWAIALTSVLVTVGGIRYPLLTSLAATGVLLLGFEFGHTGPVVAKVGAAIALTELAARTSGRAPWFAAVALAGAYLTHPGDSLAATGYRALVMAGLPLLIGHLLGTARANAARAEAQAREIAQRRASEVAAARAVERTAIARELHDLIAHHVSSTVLRVGIARHALPDAPGEVLQVLDEIHSSGRQTLVDLRKLVTILRDPNGNDESFIAPADLAEALDTATERARGLGVGVEADIDPDIAEVDALTALTLLRLAQEGLANTSKHAGPGARARLEVRMSEGTVNFTLRDRGGRTRGHESSWHGVGLIGLRERVELLGGSFSAGSSEGGWLITAHLPMRSRVAA